MPLKLASAAFSVAGILFVSQLVAFVDVISPHRNTDIPESTNAESIVELSGWAEASFGLPPISVSAVQASLNRIPNIRGVAVDRIVVMPDPVKRHVRAILAGGQALGRDSHAFSKVGDSTMVYPPFLAAFGALSLAPPLPGAAQRPSTNRRFDKAKRELGQDAGHEKAHDEQRNSVDGDIQLRPGNHQDGPMPQVDAVRPQADPSERLSVQEARTQMGLRVHCSGDRERSGKPDQRKTTLIEQRLELVEPNGCPCEERERPETD